MYHSHHNAAIQVTRGLLGAFIIEPRNRRAEPAYDAEWTIILNDTGAGSTLNGKSFPATRPGDTAGRERALGGVAMLEFASGRISRIALYYDARRPWEPPADRASAEKPAGHPAGTGD